MLSANLSPAAPVSASALFTSGTTLARTHQSPEEHSLWRNEHENEAIFRLTNYAQS